MDSKNSDKKSEKIQYEYEIFRNLAQGQFNRLSLLLTFMITMSVGKWKVWFGKPNEKVFRFLTTIFVRFVSFFGSIAILDRFIYKMF